MQPVAICALVLVRLELAARVGLQQVAPIKASPQRAHLQASQPRQPLLRQARQGYKVGAGVDWWRLPNHDP